MSSPSDDPKSPEISSLLDLLNASEAHAGQVDFKTLEGRAAKYEDAQNQLHLRATRLAELAEAMRTIGRRLVIDHENRRGEVEQATPPDQSLAPGVNHPETRYAAHVVRAMKKIKKDNAG